MAMLVECRTRQFGIVTEWVEETTDVPALLSEWVPGLQKQGFWVTMTNTINKHGQLEIAMRAFDKKADLDYRYWVTDVSMALK